MQSKYADDKLKGRDSELISLYKKNLSDRKIALQMNVSSTAIRYFRVKHKMPPNRNPFFNGNNYKLTAKEDLIRQMNKDGKSDVEIANVFGVMPSAICTFRWKLGIKAVKQYNFAKNSDIPFPFDPYNPKELMSTDFGQTLIGTMLGDGYVSRSGKRLDLEHSIHQKNYLRYKVKKLAPLTFKDNLIKGSDSGFGNGTSKIRARTPAMPFFDHIRQIFYKGKQKIIPLEYISLMDIRGLLIWVFDDGSIVRCPSNYDLIKITICCKGFERKELEKTIGILKENLGFDNITLHKEKTIYFSKKDAIKFCKMALPYLPEGLESKSSRIKGIVRDYK